MEWLEACQTVLNEAMRAEKKHPPMNSHHEAFGVIYEEFMMEYLPEICKGGGTPRDPEAIQLELTQTAAMCLRALHDLC